MAWPVLPHGFLGAQGDQDTYQIERSLRFNSADSAYLSRTPASAGNRKTWTWSGWVKISKFSSDRTLFDGGATGPLCSIWIDPATNKIRWYFTNSAVSASESAYTSALIRDPSAWYHFVFALDTTQATLSERAKIYINGVQQTLTGLTGTYLTQNSDQGINRNIAHYIGAYSYTGLQSYFDGYLTEINFIDGQALTPSSFGETDAITGRWKAKAYSGTYGTNGFYLNFSDNSSLTTTSNVGIGKDFSGNGNYWATNGLSITAGAGNDSLVDSPTNYGTDTGVGGEVRGNYCTLNALDNGGLTLANGNLDASRATASWASIRSSVGMSSGRWYWEITPTSGISVGSTANQIMIGISKQSATLGGFYQSAEGWGYYYNDGNKWNNNSGSSYGATFTNNDVIGVAFDADNGTLVFYKNNVSQGTAFSGLTSGPYFPTHGLFGTASSVANFGQRPFAYTAPSGFKALCTTNLPTPTIQKPSSYMDVVTYTGNGSTQTISGLGFSPDLVWIKSRSSAGTHVLTDIVRGTGKQLFSSSTNSEGSETDQITAFNSNGFSLGANIGGTGSTNQNTTTYVAWLWDEAPIAGMDIVSYTGDGVNARQLSHNLGVPPSMWIVKRRNSAVDWYVAHGSEGFTKYLILNGTAAASTGGLWFNSSPTSSFIYLGGTGNDVNEIGGTYIAYLFAEVEGFSKFGSYTGNGSADGPFVFTGMRSRWIMIKRTDTAGNSWVIHDTARDSINLASIQILANTSDAETNTDVTGRDILSNGFKIRGTNAGVNASGATYIFAAFAESPFKYARAR